MHHGKNYMLTTYRLVKKVLRLVNFMQRILNQIISIETMFLVHIGCPNKSY